MKLRKRTPTSQLVDDTGMLVNPGWLLAGLCLAGAAKAIEPPFEVFYPPNAIPFGAGWSLAHFLSSSQAVILVLFMLAGGTLGDLYGRRKVLLWGILTMLAANLLLLLSLNTLWHVIWRTLAIFSAGVVLPLTLAPIYVFFEGRQRNTAFAIYITLIALAGFLATYQGRFFTQLLDWRGAYLLPGLLSIVAYIFIRRSLPESRTANPNLMDTVIHSGWTVLVLAIVYTILQLGIRSEWLIFMLVTAGIAMVAGLALIIWWKRKTHGSLTRTATIQTRHVTILIVCGVILQIALFGVNFLSYSYYRIVQNLNFSQTILSLSPMFLGMLSSVFLIARFWSAHEVRRVVAAGFLLVFISTSVMAVLARAPYWMQILPLVIFGISIIAAKTVWTNAFFQTLIDKYIGLNAGINSATLLVGSAFAGFLTNALLTVFGEAAFEDQAASLSLSEGALESMYHYINTLIEAGEQAGLQDLATLVSQNLYAFYQQAFITGYTLTLVVIALLCLSMTLLIFLGIRAQLKFQPQDEPLDDEQPGQ